MLLAKTRSGYQSKRVEDTRSPDRFFCDAARPSGDPTGTYDIRRRYVTQAQVRFRAVLKLLREAVVKQDILGLRPGTVSPLVLAYATGQRTMAFQGWVDQLLRSTVVGVDGAWLRPMIAAGYTRAVKRGIRLTRKVVTPEGAADAAANLAVLATVEIQGIVEAVSQRVLRASSLAYINKWSPERTFADMERAVMQVGLVRTRSMVGLMVVKAFTEGSMDQFAAAGFRRVGLIPETIRDARREGPGARSREQLPSRRTVQRIRRVQRSLEELQLANIVTAGDDKVCQRCQDIEEDNPYTIDEARSLIPAHPDCRCAFVPLDDGVPDDDDFLEEE